MSKSKEQTNKLKACQIWKDLEEVQVDTEDCIESTFMDFPVGTYKFDIWAWIEEDYNVSIMSLAPTMVATQDNDFNGN